MTRILTFLLLTLILLSCQSNKPTETEEQTDIVSTTPVISGEEVSYTSDSVTMKGYLAYNSASGEKRPAILVVHEWWGHNDYSRKRADMLAEMGYTALAVDMYGNGKQAEHPSDAGAFAGMVMSNMDGAKARFMSALEILKSHPSVDPDKVAAIGYCFGGGVVLNMARMGVDLDGVVSFHGSLGTANPAQPGMVQSKILVCHGAEDSFISAEVQEAFKKEMSDAGADLEFIAYEGAKHSFTNPGADAMEAKFQIGIAYNEAADKASWEDMKRFFGGLW